MIRPATYVCLLLAGVSGLALYQSKHRTHLLDREIMRTLRATAQTEERIAVLRTEWALLNEPERLAELSQRHLGLRTLAPEQFVPAAEIAAPMPRVSNGRPSPRAASPNPTPAAWSRPVEARKPAA